MPLLSNWFPRPQSAEDLELLGPAGQWTTEHIFQLLTDPQSKELRDKVGVMSPADGSAKVTTRLLRSSDWFFKSDETHRSQDAQLLRDEWGPVLERAKTLELWHPDKCWFLLHRDPFYWPISICPAMTTLRQLTDWAQRRVAWTQMLRMGLETCMQKEVGLDLNPSNFGFESDSPDRLYYLDDETYSGHGLQDIAEAVVGRIPEETTLPEAEWECWGRELQELLKPYCRDYASWLNLTEGIKSYPLPFTLDHRRNALIGGLSKENPFLDREARKELQAKQNASPTDWLTTTTTNTEPQITLVFADIHGNLPALEAVLKAAREMRVDSYVFLGDVVGYGPFPRECLEQVRQLPQAITLRGNHDQMAGDGVIEDGVNKYARTALEWTHAQLRPEERHWLEHLDTEHRENGWWAVHGAPICPHRFRAYVYEITYKDNLQCVQDNNCQVCFYGHSHVQFVHRRRKGSRDEKLVPSSVKLFQNNETLLVNPGAVGQPRDGDPRAAFAIWDRRNNFLTFHRVEYDLERMTAAIQKVDFPEDLAMRLEIGR